jgi:hypothetical protein
MNSMATARDLLDAYRAIDDVGADFDHWTLWTPEGHMIRMVTPVHTQTVEGRGDIIAVEWIVRAGRNHDFVDNMRVGVDQPVDFTVGERSLT